MGTQEEEGRRPGSRNRCLLSLLSNRWLPLVFLSALFPLILLPAVADHWPGQSLTSSSTKWHRVFNNKHTKSMFHKSVQGEERRRTHSRNWYLWWTFIDWWTPLISMMEGCFHFVFLIGLFFRRLDISVLAHSSEASAGIGVEGREVWSWEGTRIWFDFSLKTPSHRNVRGFS